jgi:hypothetical protein
LSNGEHVLTASDVTAMGGQRAVYEFRANLHRGFADGGTRCVCARIVVSGAFVGAPMKAVTNNYNTFNVPAIETQDSRVYATIIGREFGRRVAG